MTAAVTVFRQGQPNRELRLLPFPDFLRSHDSVGLCRDVDPELFWPVSGNDEERVSKAKAVCAVCPLQVECAEWGMREPYGIWGGLTEEERDALRRLRRR